MAVGVPWLFGSLFLGGFECSTHVTADGRRMDLIAATQHDRQVAEEGVAAAFDLTQQSGPWRVIVTRPGGTPLKEVPRSAGCVGFFPAERLPCVPTSGVDCLDWTRRDGSERPAYPGCPTFSGRRSTFRPRRS